MSDFTPCMHDILPIQKVMIHSVVLLGHWSDVSLLSEEVRMLGCILKKWEYLTQNRLYWGSWCCPSTWKHEVFHMFSFSARVFIFSWSPDYLWQVESCVYLWIALVHIYCLECCTSLWRSYASYENMMSDNMLWHYEIINKAWLILIM